MAEIILENVNKRFKNAQVLNNISLHCQAGKIYGFVGHNGCGKTVLFKCICGYLKYDSGVISVNGKIMGKQLDIIPNAGIIIEEPGFIYNKSAFYNLDFLYRINHSKNKQYIMDTLRLVGLEPESRKWVGRFSLGMKQRLAIAQAIMDDPEILILDEPMNGLDKDGIEEMRRIFLEQKRRNKVILLASHNPLDIDTLCDEVYEFEKGSIVKRL